MDFTLSEDQELRRDTARALLTTECPPALVRAHIDDPTVAAPLWEHLRDFTALGTGPAVDLCLFMEEHGYVAAPGVFFPTTALYLPLLAAIDPEAAELAIADGTSGTVAVAGADGAWIPNDEARRTLVLEADRVDHVMVVGTGGRVTMLTSPPFLRFTGAMDFSRRFFDVEVGDDAAGETVTIGLDALADVLARATLATAADMVGVARRVLDMTIAYARERVQFDRPIGSFQAVQHKLADMALDVNRAASAVAYAAMTVDASDAERFRAVHVAKAAAGDAARRAAKDGIQIHGGVGYTWEHDLHLYLRRCYGGEYLLGTSGWHEDRLGALLLG